MGKKDKQRYLMLHFNAYIFNMEMSIVEITDITETSPYKSNPRFARNI